MVILAAAYFSILSTANTLKGYSTGQLVFGRDMILLIKHKVDWELILQINRTQINKYNIHENSKRVDHNYKVGDKFMINDHDATPFKVSFVITKCWNNGTVTLHYDPKTIRHNLCQIKPYTSGKNVEYINIEK